MDGGNGQEETETEGGEGEGEKEREIYDLVRKPGAVGSPHSNSFGLRTLS